MNFFDTVAGHEFTKYTLPQLIAEIEKINKKQKTLKCKKEELSDEVEKLINNGFSYVSHIISGNESLIIYK